jgi:hypothetical protein
MSNKLHLVRATKSLTRGIVEQALTKRPMSVEQVIKMLEIAQQKSPRDFLIYRLMAANGFRPMDVIGSPPRRRAKPDKKWAYTDPTSEGLQIEDLRKDGVRIRFTEKPSVFKRIKPEVVIDIKNFIGNRTDGKIFDLTGTGLESNTRSYAKIANPTWKVSPRMFYDFYRCASRLYADVDEVLGLKITPDRILRLARQRKESEELEYKSEISNANDFLKTVVAFANKKGGDILIGVEDNGDILGVSDKDLAGIEKRIAGLAHEFCNPAISYNTERAIVETRHVVVVHINEGSTKPYWLKDKGPYIRRESDDWIMTRDECRTMVRALPKRARVHLA